MTQSPTSQASAPLATWRRYFNRLAFTQRQLASILVLGQAFFFWWFCGSQAAASISAAAAIACLVGVRMRLPAVLFYSVVTMIAAAFAYYTMFYFDIAEGSFAIYPTRVTRPLGEVMLVWQGLLLIRKSEQGGDLVSGVFLYLSFAAVLCAFDQGDELRWGWYAIFALLFLMLGVLVHDRTTGWSGKSRGGRRKAAINVCAVSALVAFSGVSAWMWGSREVRTKLPSLAVEATGASRVQLYVSSGQLGRIGREQLERPNEVAFRVTSNSQPGYMRGRVYDIYVDSLWRAARGRGSRPELYSSTRVSELPRGSEPAAIRRSNRSQSVFQLKVLSNRPLRRMEIRNDARRGEMFFTPLGLNYILGRGKRIRVDHNGVVLGGLGVARPYVTYDEPSGVTPALSTSQRELLTSLPSGLDPQVAKLAADIWVDGNSTRAKVKAVEQFLLNNYQYELTDRTQRSAGEPLSRFLLTRHPAHCEYFASAAVILLRMKGVPARYVTGYVVTDVDEEYGEYWIARNRNAHAWVEAFDAEARRWLIVEATPGMEDVLGDEAVIDDQSVEDSGADEFWEVSATTSWNEFFRTLATQLAAPTILLSLVGGGAWFGWRRYKNSIFASQDPLDQELVRRRRELRRIERRLRRRGLVRRSDETWRRFASRVLSAGEGDTEMLAAEQVIRQYAHFRYHTYVSAAQRT